MKARNKIGIVAILVLGVLVAIAVVGATGPEETRENLYAEQNRSPWVDENGVWDNSQAPATFNVLDRTGAVVGYVKNERRGCALSATRIRLGRRTDRTRRTIRLLRFGRV